MFSSRNDTIRSRSGSPRRFIDRIRERLADEAFHRYLDWRAECATLEAAYRNWRTAARSDSAFAFAAYTAALDREECAAVQYRCVIAEAERLLPEAR